MWHKDVLLRVKEQRNIVHEIRKRKANWIGHILRRNCLLQRVVEGKIQEGTEATGRQGRRRRKLLDDLKERRGYSQLKEEALDRTMWRARFGRGFGPVVRQTTKWMNVAYLALPYFSTFFINGRVLKKIFEHKMFVLIFCTRVFGKFFTLKITERDSIKNVCRFSCEMPVILVRFWWHLEFSRLIFEKYSNRKFHENPCRVSRVVPCGRTDRQTDRPDEDSIRLSQFW